MSKNMSKMQTGSNNSFYGKKHTKEWKERQIKMLLNRKLKTVTCPKCGKSGKENVMKMHHFENCGKETNYLNSKRKILKCPHCGKEGGAAGMQRHHFDNCKFKDC